VENQNENTQFHCTKAVVIDWFKPATSC